MNAYFGEFGGCFAPETLIQPLKELEDAYITLKESPEFQAELASYLQHYSGRPTALTFARNLTELLGGAQIYLKREDLNHTGAHKINNALGQALLAKMMGKTTLIAETGAGQHGVATATVAALFGMNCVIYMGEKDMARQSANVSRMKLLGAHIEPVKFGSKTLKDATSQALRAWVSSAKSCYYLIGSALGPHPYPTMVRDFQVIIGKEARQQMIEHCGQLPTHLIACIGGGSNAIGLFDAFLADDHIIKIGVEAGGKGSEPGSHACRIGQGSLGVLQGTKTILLQDDDGNILPTHSISAGLDYPAIGPEHAHLHIQGKVQYVSVTDEEALAAGKLLAKQEGILPALESAHAIAYAIKLAPTLHPEARIIINLSGRGDKDLENYVRGHHES